MVYWVFGYGSLIFKPPVSCHLDNPRADSEGSGYVKGVVRRFAQSSNDHRGTPEHPGRVVTVVEAKVWHALEGIELKDDEILPDDYVWGIAYRIDPEKAEEVKAYMEYREKHGYTCHLVPVYTLSADGKEEIISVESSTIWIGKPEDPAFVGYEPLDTLAKTILVREGPSGPNKDYLFKLAESVRHLYPHVKDDYLFNLEVGRP
ncbi:hypothetical protein D1P53_003562 [Cryptococcus gattii VGV]|nr:hypothetical protein D1P53_003562 [Cryptococcus gattii VGV]